MYHHDGQTPLGRISVGRQLLTVSPLTVGLELGLQNGNAMRLNFPQATLDKLGGLSIAGEIKPVVDLLITAHSAPLVKAPLFIIAKAGLAYRQFQMARNSIDDKRQTAFEQRAGLGLAVNSHLNLQLVYQHIGGKYHTLLSMRLQKLEQYRAFLANMPYYSGFHSDVKSTCVMSQTNLK